MPKLPHCPPQDLLLDPSSMLGALLLHTSNLAPSPQSPSHTSRTRPSPLHSFSLQTIPGTIANCGVMYYNVRAFERTQAALLDYADSKHWEFDDDQDLFRHFFQPWMVTALPDAFNYKPYWGEREYLKPEPLFKEQALAEVSGLPCRQGGTGGGSQHWPTQGVTGV